jgi:hypothetical protein
MRPPTDLEHLLADSPYLDDQGFTAGVMARLPEPAPRARPLRGIILGVSLCASFAVATALPASRVVIAAVRETLAPLLAFVLDPLRSGTALVSAGTSTGTATLALGGVVLMVDLWGAAAIGRDEAR